MRTNGGSRPTAGVLERERRRLIDGLSMEVFDDVRRHGFAHVPDILPASERRRLLREAEIARSRFLALPERVNGVQQRADQLTLRVGHPHQPAVNELSRSLREAVKGWPAASGAAQFSPTEARYMRYTGTSAGLGPHRDGKCYRLLVCVLSLAGSARFSVLADGVMPATDVLVEPGDLIVLRAPGFAGGADGRRRHAVGPPLDDERISLTVRMVGGTMPVARPWARSA